MALKLDDLLPAIVKAAASGMTKGEIDKKFAGTSKGKERAGELRDRLAALTQGGAIRGPFKSGRSQYYFARDHGPSIETASQAICTLVFRAGVSASGSKPVKPIFLSCYWFFMSLPT